MTKLRKLCCRICGEEIRFTYERPNSSFSIINGKLAADYNNFMTGPDLVAHCGNDKEHDIYPQPHDNISIEDFDKWLNNVEEYFREKVLEWL